MDPTIAAAFIAAFTGLCGVAIGTTASLLTSFLANRYTSRLQRDQWERDRRTEHDKWLRDKLHEIYTNCIYFVQVPNDYVTRSKWLNQLLIYQLDTPDFKEFCEKVKVGSVQEADIVELASKDPRLKGEWRKHIT
jgi:hypothetical protein